MDTKVQQFGFGLQDHLNPTQYRNIWVGLLHERDEGAKAEVAGWRRTGFDFWKKSATLVENGKVFVMTNPFAPNDQMAIDERDIAKKGTRKVSMMPPGLINALNQDELLDLMAYLVSGGNAQDKAFAK